MNTWRERHDAAVAAQAKAWDEYIEATDERARALLDGVTELGSQAEVGRALGVTRASINQAIKALEKKRNPSQGTPEGPTE